MDGHMGKTPLGNFSREIKFFLSIFGVIFNEAKQSFLNLDKSLSERKYV